MRNWYLIYKDNELYGRTYSDCKARKYSTKEGFNVVMCRTQRMGEIKFEAYIPWGER